MNKWDRKSAEREGLDGWGTWGGWRAKGTLNTQEEREWEQKIQADQGRWKGAKIVSVCVVIKRFMGAGEEEEGGGGGGSRGVLQPLFLLYSLNLRCVDGVEGGSWVRPGWLLLSGAAALLFELVGPRTQQEDRGDGGGRSGRKWAAKDKENG